MTTKPSRPRDEGSNQQSSEAPNKRLKSNPVVESVKKVLLERVKGDTELLEEINKDWGFASDANSFHEVLKLAFFHDFFSIKLKDLIKNLIVYRIQQCAPNWNGPMDCLRSEQLFREEFADHKLKELSMKQIMRDFGLDAESKQKEQQVTNIIFDEGEKIFPKEFIEAMRSVLEGKGKANVQISKSNCETLVTDLKSSHGQFVFRDFIWIRQCYVRLFTLLLQLGQKNNICVLGDPGIGKSVFAQYTFLGLCALGVKCILVAQNSEARVFDGKECLCKSLFKYDPRTYDGYWVLIDGKATVDYLGVGCKGIVFASPQKSNYHEFIKQNGTFLYMPTWTREEVKKLSAAVPLSEIQSTVESWYRRDNYITPSEDDVDGTARKSKELLPNSVNISAIQIPESVSKELKNDQTARTLFFEHLEKRFELIGGRVRLLLNPHLTTAELRDKLRSCIHLIDFKYLVWAEDIDESDGVPSLYYSIVTTAESLYQSKSIDFCSPTARRMAFAELERRKRESAVELFDAARNSSVVTGRPFGSTKPQSSLCRSDFQSF